MIETMSATGPGEAGGARPRPVPALAAGAGVGAGAGSPLHVRTTPRTTPYRWGLVCSIPFIVAWVSTAGAAVPEPPYPRSPIITGIEFHRDTLERAAPGSDIWACTTATDGTVHAAWGDGGGFGGTDSKGRASIGVGRITGVPPNWQGVNLWGGANALSNQAPTVGKGTIIAVENLLYLYISEQGKWDRCRLWRSADQGLSWSDRGWIFPQSHRVFAFPGLVQ